MKLMPQDTVFLRVTFFTAILCTTFSVWAETEDQGAEIKVGPTAHRVGDTTAIPPCSGTAIDANAPVKKMLDESAVLLATAKDPRAALAAAAVKVIAEMVPKDEYQTYANCALPCVPMPQKAVIERVGLVYVIDGTGKDPKNPKDWTGIAQEDLKRPDAGPGWIEAEAANVVSIGKGRKAQCVLVRNWSHDRTIHVKADVHYRYSK